MTPANARDPVSLFSSFDPETIALLLDVDGTLIDIAPTPHDVHVPESLCRTLGRLLGLVNGALALVSGRPIADLDRLFSPLMLPAIGGHGAETRVDGERLAAEPLPEALRQRLVGLGTIASGIIVEDKHYSLALHYRNAPQCEAELRRRISEACSASGDDSLEVLPGKALFEVKRRGISKGVAVRALMDRVPFKGRQPVFIGDDVTDESVFALLPGLGGVGFSVQRQFAHVSGIFHSPGQVRDALEALASR